MDYNFCVMPISLGPRNRLGGAVMVEAPTVGLHTQLLPEIYHLWDAASHSRLEWMLKSPAHCRWHIDHPDEPTAAMRLGTAFHAAILQPQIFADRYVALPSDIDRRTKDGKAAYAQLEAEYGLEYILSSDSYRLIECMAAAIGGHKAAGQLIDRLSEVELSGVWNDELTSCRCKMRVDGLVRGVAAIDIKTTLDASPESFPKTIFNLGYHRQGAFYLSGLAALGEQVEHFCIIAVEKEPPYGVAVYRLTNEAISAGMAQSEDLLLKYATCQKLGEWPCYPGSVQDISLPEWAFKTIEKGGLQNDTNGHATAATSY